MTNILEIEGVNLEFGYKTILSDVYIKCETGKIIGLLGRNGAGKSSLFKIAFGTIHAQNELIRFNNAPINRLKNSEAILSYLPQFNFIPKGLKVEKIFRDFKLDIDLFVEYFPGFRQKNTYSLRSFSGGEIRLIEVYVIVMSNSLFSILDEPFTHIAPVEVRRIKELLMMQKSRKGFIISDHKYQDVIEISDELYLLSDGASTLIRDHDDLIKLGYLKR